MIETHSPLKKIVSASKQETFDELWKERHFVIHLLWAILQF